MLRFCSWLVLCILLGLAVVVSAEQSSDVVPVPDTPPPKARAVVGMVLDGPWVRTGEIRDLFQAEIARLMKSEYAVSFPEEKCLNADGTPPGVHSSVDRLLKDPSVDFVIALGVLSSMDVSSRGPLPKPVIAPFVVDGAMLGFKQKDGASGIENLVYLTSPAPFRRDLEAFHDLVPFKKLAILGSSILVGAAPQLRENCLRVAQELGFDVSIVLVGDSIEKALGELPAGTDAVYVSPLIGYTDEDVSRLASILIERKLPSFSLLGRREVERGLLATITPDTDFERLARRTALYIQRVLMGERPEKLPVSFSKGEQLTINMATARAIGFSPTWSVLTEATLLHEDAESGQRLTLKEAVTTAVDENLEILASSYKTAAGAQSIEEARAKLLPTIEASTLGLVIDGDRAAAMLGLQAEKSWSFSLTLTQVLYAEQAWANLDVQKYLQEGREWERERLRLDIALETAKAYLNLMRARAGERIRRSALKMTHSHLEMAQVRKAIGVASPAEVYRWENEIATSRKALIDAEALRATAEANVNRLIHRTQGGTINAGEVTEEDTNLLREDSPIKRYLETPATFDVFLRFMVQEGLANAPELRQYDAGIKAAGRGVRSYERSFYTPVVGLHADVTHRVYEGGKGVEGPIPIPILPTEDETDYDIAVKASLPVYAGGSRKASLERLKQTVSQLQTERAATEEKLELRVRAAVLAARASNADIEQNRKAAEAAHKGLDLVSDAYAQGFASIVDLLDAQTAATVSDELAANSVYDFLLNLMDAERAANTMGFFLTNEQRDALYSRMNAFFEKEGVSVGIP